MKINKFLLISIFILIGLGAFWAVRLGSPKNILFNPIGADADTLEFRKTSKISISKLSPQQIENLDVLGKVWGMMKYYHPAVAKGKYNWDYELFRIMPKVLDADSKDKRDRVLVKWINSFGRLPQSNKQPKEDSLLVKVYSDFKWINDKTLLNKKLSGLLQKLKCAQTDSVNYYVSLFPNVENPNFQHENPYTDMHYPDAGYRILSLYRYWNMIQYYYPYKYLIGEDWNKVLAEFIPVFVNAKNELEYQLAMLKLITRINDSHADIYQNKTIDSYRGIYFALAIVSFIEEKAVIRKTFDEISEKGKSCLQEGDLLIKINGKTIEEKIKELTPIIPASNESTHLRDIGIYLLHSTDTILNIEFERNGIRFIKNVKCYILDSTLRNKLILQKQPQAWKMLRDNIGYFYIGSLYRDSIALIMKKFEDTKGIVIDLRCYPTDHILYELGDYLMPQSTDFVKFTNVNISRPGDFSYKCTYKIGKENFNYYKGKIAILVNEYTQSAAEFNAMGFRVAPRAAVIGSTTAGADGNVSFIMLPGDIKTAISGIGVYYPDGRETQRVGIIPDIEVKPTIKGFQEGKDEVLEKAIEWIKEK